MNHCIWSTIHPSNGQCTGTTFFNRSVPVHGGRKQKESSRKFLFSLSPLTTQVLLTATIPTSTFHISLSLYFLCPVLSSMLFYLYFVSSCPFCFSILSPFSVFSLLLFLSFCFLFPSLLVLFMIFLCGMTLFSFLFP